MSLTAASTPAGSDALPALDVAPWRLTGTVVGAAIADPALLDALGERVGQAPYRGAPRAPVLYVKPRHTLAAACSAFTLPAGADAVEVAATLALVIGHTACRVDAAAAAGCIAARALAVDLGLPLVSWYRPAAPARALDGSLRLGPPQPAAADVAAAPATLQVFVDGRLAQQVDTGRFLRTSAQLVAEVSEFMTLAAGDVLLVGLPHAAPLVRGGQRVHIEGSGLGSLQFTVEGAP
ncbi:MAG TPA: fumarylacetoacetate hydrolase family protein [Rubrivivax sp.]|nr:fumarylacetoacetate hydrolase family protein [Rubrivivax sp.]